MVAEVRFHHEENGGSGVWMCLSDFCLCLSSCYKIKVLDRQTGEISRFFSIIFATVIETCRGGWEGGTSDDEIFSLKNHDDVSGW